MILTFMLGEKKSYGYCTFYGFFIASNVVLRTVSLYVLQKIISIT